MRKTACLLGVFALAIAIWPPARTGAEPRCYPTERFKVLDAQWVRDTLTKLVWQRQASASEMTWGQAQTYCKNAGLRLPTVKELRSIVDFTIADPGPTIDQKAFPNTPSQSFWTSSPYPAASSAWSVSFKNGVSSPPMAEGVSLRVRCVR
jgi:hypothetical protein